MRREELTALAAAALRAHGASETMAACTARRLVAADAQGLPTHGVMRVAAYCAHLRSGRVRGDAVPRVAREKGATALIDAGDGLAYPAIDLALAEAIRRAQSFGAGFAGVFGSHHSGALGILLEPVAAAGLGGSPSATRPRSSCRRAGSIRCSAPTRWRRFSRAGTAIRWWSICRSRR